jgi:hypothetical protein
MKVRYAATLAAMLFFCLSAHAQRVHYVSIKPRTITIQDRSFYIENIYDDRVDTTNIGIVYVGPFKAHHQAAFYHSCSTSLKRFFAKALPQMENQMPVVIRVKKLRIEERVNNMPENGWVDMTLLFYYQGKLVYQSVQRQGSKANDVTSEHEGNLVTALENAILDFSQNGWRNRLVKVGPDGSPLPEGTASEN